MIPTDEAILETMREKGKAEHAIIKIRPDVLQ